jgi:hypothetical protein
MEDDAQARLLVGELPSNVFASCDEALWSYETELIQLGLASAIPTAESQCWEGSYEDDYDDEEDSESDEQSRAEGGLSESDGSAGELLFFEDSDVLESFDRVIDEVRDPSCVGRRVFCREESQAIVEQDCSPDSFGLSQVMCEPDISGALLLEEESKSQLAAAPALSKTYYREKRLGSPFKNQSPVPKRRQHLATPPYTPTHSVSTKKCSHC